MVSDVQTLFTIDYKNLIIGILLIITAVLALWKIWDEIQKRTGIETKWSRMRREQRELLNQTAKNLAALQEKHEKDENEIKTALDEFIAETRAENNKLRQEMRTFTENRIHDREQSLEIQKELSNSIQAVVDSQEERDQQIQALMCGSKELLGTTIDSLYGRYIELDGIPENEVDEFDDIFEAYSKLKGNGKRRSKYHYVKEHLPVIPVETKLITK